MKVAGNGQAKILNSEELRLLFDKGLTNPRDRALFAICLYTKCRVSEALGLQTTDIKGGTLTFRKSTTKGKLKTRVVDIQDGLAEFLAAHTPKPGPMFPGKRGVTERLTRYGADKVLREAAKRVGLEGVSTHSFGRTALNQMSSAGIPLRHIQEISGHNDLGSLQRYLEVSPEQRRQAVWLDCAKLGVLYAKKLEQSPKALPLKIFGGQLFWNFLTRIGLKYKKFHLDDTF